MTVCNTGLSASRRHTNRKGNAVLVGSSMDKNVTSSAGTADATEDNVSDAPMPTPTSSMTVQESGTDRKSTRLNSSHVAISYAVFCLQKKNRPAQTEATIAVVMFHVCAA